MGLPKPTLEELVHSGETSPAKGAAKTARVVAVADLPTRFGEFEVAAFHSPLDGKEHASLVLGNVADQEKVPVRLHSECLTGDAFGSLRCDCREQLELAMAEIQRRGIGVLLYLRQEGRGIGFEAKIKAYRLQELGLDTIEANEALGFRADERDYAIAAAMLKVLKVRSILLMSNNPAKAADLKAHGTRIVGRIPLEVPPNPHNARYLETKRVRAGHLLSKSPWPLMMEQLDCLHAASSSGPEPSEE
ncbi:MAG TPA: GTP cyclohydrolase II [Thermoplasmata archaeon]|nr:GTP cyclohydrolase II [Thermoplasmata archaeon]